jgi:IrrE N-terminal-like domain
MTSISSCILALEAFIERNGARVLRAELPPCVHGRICRDLITLRADLSPEQELLTLVHELAHWLAHRGALRAMDCTLFEYEAEAVEALVMARLGLPHSRYDCRAPRYAPTDNLLSASVARVVAAAARICGALGLEAQMPGSEAQAAVELETAAGEEIVFEYEQYGMGDFFGLPEAL